MGKKNKEERRTRKKDKETVTDEAPPKDSGIGMHNRAKELMKQKRDDKKRERSSGDDAGVTVSSYETKRSIVMTTCKCETVFA